jgi:hypothetical protein
MKTNDEKTEEPSADDDAVVYSVETLHNKQGCAHHFERVGATKVECTKCHMGLVDSPDRPFPLTEVNEHYLKD